MRTYITFEEKAFFFQKKILGLLVLWLLIGLGLLGQIIFLDYGNHEADLYNELNDTRVVLRSVETYYRESETEVTLADNLYEQQGLLAMKYNGIKFEESDWFYDAGIELAELRLAADDYSDEKVPPTLFPSRDVSERQLVEYEALQKADLHIRIDSKNVYDYGVKLLSIYGTIAFIFTLLLSSDVGLRDLSHPTLVKSYPIQANSRQLIQTGIVSLGGTVGLVLLTGVNIGLAQVVWSTNDWLRPIGYYGSLQYVAIPLVQYIVRFAFYLLVLMMHTTLFSFLMNQVFKNQYVTIMTGSLLYATSFLLTSNQGWMRWLPFPYYHVDNVLTGFLAEQVHPEMHLMRGVLILFIWGMVFIGLSFILTSPRRGKENHDVAD